MQVLTLVGVAVIAILIAAGIAYFIQNVSIKNKDNPSP